MNSREEATGDWLIVGSNPQSQAAIFLVREKCAEQSEQRPRETCEEQG